MLALFAVWSRQVSVDLSEFTRPRDLYAHSLGVLPDPRDEDMARLLRYSRQELIVRHQAHLCRLHAGIRARALEHASEVEDLKQHASELGDAIRALQIDNARLRRHRDWRMIGMVVVVLFVAWWLG